MGIFEKVKNKFLSSKLNLNILQLLCYIGIVYVMDRMGISLYAGLVIILLSCMSDFITHMRSMAMGMLYILMKEDKKTKG